MAFKTLKELQKKAEEANVNTGGAKYVNLKKDGDNIVMFFRQELSEDGKNFDPERGTAELVAVHRSPYDFKKQMRCTAENEDQGFKCWACEMVTLDTNVDPKTDKPIKGRWRAQNHILINVGVQVDDDTWENQVLDQTFYKSHVGETMVEYALEEGSLQTSLYKFKRKGESTSTSYTLIPKGLAQGEPESLKDEELVDLKVAKYKTIPYEKQEEFFDINSDANTSEASDNKGWL